MIADSILDEAFTALIAVPVPITAACALTGRSRATHYRRITTTWTGATIKRYSPTGNLKSAGDFLTPTAEATSSRVFNHHRHRKMHRSGVG